MSLSDAHYFEEMGVKKYEEIRVLLDTRENKDKIEGMKRLLAMISIGRDASSFFPDVTSHCPLSSVGCCFWLLLLLLLLLCRRCLPMSLFRQYATAAFASWTASF